MASLKYSDQGGGWDFTCECTDNKWCQHIEELVRGHDDAKVFWDFVEDNAHKHWWPVEIPIIPTEHVIAWAKVARSNSMEPWSLHLVWDNPFESEGVPSSEKNLYRLGTTGPGEGMFVWRGLVWDYFQSQISKEHTKCTSRAHTFAAQGKLAADLRNSGSGPQRAQVFSIWYQGCCTFCLQKRSADHYRDIDDLIPAVGGKQNWANLTAKPKPPQGPAGASRRY